MIIWPKNSGGDEKYLTRNSKWKRSRIYFKIQPDKCELPRKEIAYLGHIITKNGVQPNPSKVEADKPQNQ